MEDDLSIWQTEDDLNILANGRQPQKFLSIEDDLNVFYNKDDLIFFFNERRPQFFFNGRQPQLFYKWKTTSIVLQMKDDLKCVCKWKMTSDSLLNGRRPESCQLRLGNTLKPA